MMNARTKWLIWAGVIVLLLIEIVALLDRSDFIRDGGRSRAADTARLSTVPFNAPTGNTELHAVASLADVSEREAGATPQPGIPDAVTLDELKRRLQPASARLNEVLLTFKTPESYAAFLRRAGASGLEVKESLDELRTARVGFNSLEQLREEWLKGTAEGAEISANYMVSVPRLPVSAEGGQGGDVPFGDTVLASIGIAAGTDRSRWGSGVTVAVVDSGVGDHPTFRPGQVVHVDLVNDGQPFDGHGTAIASLVAGSMEGAQGVAPGASILDVRIADGAGGSDSFLLARGILVAVDRGVDVINVSMGSYGDAPVVQAAVARALERGVLVVAAAGNEGAPMLAWPAAYADVISVTGLDARGQVAYFSNTGNPTLAAPAVGIPSAYWQASKPYLAMGSGTSQSTALVSGVAAYIIGRGGNAPLTLSRSAQRLEAPSQSVGAGMLRVPVW